MRSVPAAASSSGTTTTRERRRPSRSRPTGGCGSPTVHHGSPSSGYVPFCDRRACACGLQIIRPLETGEVRPFTARIGGLGSASAGQGDGGGRGRGCRSRRDTRMAGSRGVVDGRRSGCGALGTAGGDPTDVVLDDQRVDAAVSFDGVLSDDRRPVFLADISTVLGARRDAGIRQRSVTVPPPRPVQAATGVSAARLHERLGEAVEVADGGECCGVGPGVERARLYGATTWTRVVVAATAQLLEAGLPAAGPCEHRSAVAALAL